MPRRAPARKPGPVTEPDEPWTIRIPPGRVAPPHATGRPAGPSPIRDGSCRIPRLRGRRRNGARRAFGPDGHAPGRGARCRAGWWRFGHDRDGGSVHGALEAGSVPSRRAATERGPSRRRGHNRPRGAQRRTGPPAAVACVLSALPRIPGDGERRGDGMPGSRAGQHRVAGGRDGAHEGRIRPPMSMACAIPYPSGILSAMRTAQASASCAAMATRTDEPGARPGTRPPAATFDPDGIAFFRRGSRRACRTGARPSPSRGPPTAPEALSAGDYAGRIR